MKRPDWTYGLAYRIVMRLAHRFNWHYAPPSYPAGDTMLWCKWCGFRQVIKSCAFTEDEIKASMKMRREAQDGR